MKIFKKETAFEGKFLRLVNKTAVTDDGHEVIWETVERINVFGSGVVAIVAITGEEEFILERHWRAAVETFVIQFPAGLMDIEDEDPEKTARRELLEETGYSAPEFIPIAIMPTNPTLTPLFAHYFFAPGAVYTGGENRDAAEEIEVIKIPVERINNFLLNPPADTLLDMNVPGIIRLMEARGLI